MKPIKPAKKMRAMLCLLGVCCSVAWFFAACTPERPPSRTSDFVYAEGAFSATLRGTYTPCGGTPHPVAAEVSVGEPVCGSDERDMTLSFTEPPALAGVTVALTVTPLEGSPDRARRVVTFTAPSPYGAVTATASHGELDGFLRFAQALLPMGDVVEVSPVDREGNHRVTRQVVSDQSADEGQEITYLFSETESLPLHVTVKTEGETLELAVSGQN